MCGVIFLSDRHVTEKDISLIKHRGPEQQRIFGNFGFVRLAINDLSENGMQPFTHDTCTWVVNGEIYNHKELSTDMVLESSSDCECIGHLLQRQTPHDVCNTLDGVFAFVAKKDDDIIAARDPIGVRPLFWSPKHTYFASEAKVLLQYCDDVVEFPPGHVYTSGVLHKYHTYPHDYIENYDIHHHLTQAVLKRMDSDAKQCFLLSGGLDSSLVAAIAAKHSKERIHTFSIGLKDGNSKDLEFARKVSEHINSIHTEVYYTVETGVSILNTLINHLESFDCTTIRASVPMYILCKYISEHTDFKVIFSGEGADELFGGYIYFKNAPSPDEFQKETVRLVENMHRYDVLRADRCIAAHGLEARVPFLDKTLVNHVLSIEPLLKVHSHGNIEKYILRKSFDLLPEEVQYRQKDAFSDAVGYSWIHELKKHTESKVDHMEPSLVNKYTQSLTKEEYYYKQIYESMFPDFHHIDYTWRAKWTNVVDPSATYLPNHTLRS